MRTLRYSSPTKLSHAILFYMRWAPKVIRINVFCIIYFLNFSMLVEKRPETVDDARRWAIICSDFRLLTGCQQNVCSSRCMSCALIQQMVSTRFIFSLSRSDDFQPFAGPHSFSFVSHLALVCKIHPTFHYKKRNFWFGFSQVLNCPFVVLVIN